MKRRGQRVTAHGLHGGVLFGSGSCGRYAVKQSCLCGGCVGISPITSAAPDPNTAILSFLLGANCWIVRISVASFKSAISVASFTPINMFLEKSR